MDDLTNALTREYDTLKEKYLVLLMQGTTESFEEMERIDEFFNAYYDHMLWMKTGGEEGNPWIEEPQENEYGTRTQESYVNPQEETPQAHTSLGNSFPILEENNSPLITTDFIESLIDESEDEVDEDIIVEHAFMFENTDAHMNECCDVLIGDVACTAPSTRFDEDIGLNDTLPCSCDDDVICMLCIDRKNDKFVAWRKKNFGKEHDISDSTRDKKLDEHEFMENNSPIKDSKISIDEIINEKESCHENESSSYCKDDVLSFKSQNEFLTPTLQERKDFNDVVDCLIPTEGNHIDFLGCDLYLESYVPKIFLIHPISLQIRILGLDTAAGPMFVLQDQTKQSHGYKSNVPTPPLFLHKHLSEKSNMRRVEIKKFMLHIRDENFSYKSLKRFKRKVVSFLSCFLLIIIWKLNLMD